jgi:chemotaxis signal transduction protein
MFVFIDGKLVVAENENGSPGMDIQKQRVSTPSDPSPLRFVMVTISGRYLAVNAGSVEGVVTLRELERHGNSTIRDVVDRTGDLIVRLGISGDSTHPKTRTLLLTDRGMRGSIRVSEVLGLLQVHQSQVLPLPAQFSGVERGWYQGMILFEKSVAMILNPTWILEPWNSDFDSAHIRGNTDPLVGSRGIAVSDGRTC